MVQTCFSRGCQSKGVKGNACSFFRFPSNETEAQYWLEKIFQLNEQTTEPSKYARVCEKHFAEQDIKRNGSRNVLKKGAIPTVCLNYVYDESIDVEYLEEEESMECGDDINTDVLTMQIQPPSSTAAIQNEPKSVNIELKNNRYAMCMTRSPTTPKTGSSHVYIDNISEKQETIDPPRRGRRLCYPGDVRDDEHS
ncbi:THAP domain-containing protein 1-like [Bradysia coprophila]|uniref:THAP domain-containing protein 1-like n=1 Tax=Bradysia coprophila TaxID=38358 RepID=UPI00187DD1E8|nr:THAP domain-containing protein 1-like [Bradysia coprophila]